MASRPRKKVWSACVAQNQQYDLEILISDTDILRGRRDTVVLKCIAQ